MQETLLLATQGEYRKAVMGLAKQGVLRRVEVGKVDEALTHFEVRQARK
jgi:hypothetical protein